MRPAFEVSIVSDASGSWGYGALNDREWFQLKWVGLGASRDQTITVKELLPIVIAAALWGPGWLGKTIRAQCENAAVIAIVNSGSIAMSQKRCICYDA